MTAEAPATQKVAVISLLRAELALARAERRCSEARARLDRARRACLDVGIDPDDGPDDLDES